MKAMAEKILVLGVDGMDPRITKRFMDQGKLPNIKKFVEAGSSREDLVLLGSNPTITPPLWTTLATGAHPMTHGITCFWNQHPEKLDTLIYALDSRMCKAEQLWNVFAEDAGKKTLVWHWPGSSWPPTSKSENLHVIEGVQPAAVNFGVAIIDWEKVVLAKPEHEKLVYKPKATSDTGAGCILTDVDAADELDTGMIANLDANNKESLNIMLTHEEGDLAIDQIPFDVVNTPLKPADDKWADAPADALEFVVITSNGFMRRPALVLKNDQGIYDRVAIYKNKKETNPLIVLMNDQLVYDVVDDILVGEEHREGNRNLRVEIASDGTQVKLWMSCAMDIKNDSLFHPKSLFETVTENAGYPPMVPLGGGKNPEIVEKLTLPCWDHYVDWQANSIKTLIKEEKYDVVFSHIHNVDAHGHLFYYFAKEREMGNDAARYQGFIEHTYVQTDRYLGTFLPLLDEGWTIFIVSDHGLVVSELEHEDIPLLGDPFGVNVGMLKELGYTVLKKDADGNEIKEIDWENTKAIATRGNHIIINLKGRNPHGIVNPADKYELETEIISALYNYRLNGRRVVNVALRNKDAVIVGMGGDQCGDIIYFLDEGANRVHGDSLSTTNGSFDTSVSPIFIAAGKGVKKGCKTERVIRQVDVTPTIAVLAGVRMPEQCEGAPIYQILEK